MKKKEEEQSAKLIRCGMGLVLGGVAYTVGVIFYRQKEKPYRHGIWHFFVLAGTTLHFFTVYLSCCG